MKIYYLLNLRGKFFSSFLASSFDYFLPVFSRHSFCEAMSSFSAQFFWLVSSFCGHFFNLLKQSINNMTVDYVYD